MRSPGAVLRAHPFGAILAVLLVVGLLLVGTRVLRSRQEADARARMVAILEDWIASHPEAPVPPVPGEEDAGPGLARALDALVRGKAATTYDEYESLAWAESYAAGNAESLRLLEEALARPRFADPGNKGNGHWLSQLTLAAVARGRVLASKGDPAGAARSLLLVHRLARVVGSCREGRFAIRWSWEIDNATGPLLHLVEAPGLAEPDLLGILEQAVTPAELGRMEEEWWDRTLLRDARDYLDILRPGGDARALQNGWIPPPTLLQRIQSARSSMPAPIPGGKGLFVPTLEDVDLDWRALLAAREKVAVRGSAALAWPESEPKDDDPRTHECFRWGLRTDALRPVALESRVALLRTAVAARLFEVRNGR